MPAAPPMRRAACFLPPRPLVVRRNASVSGDRLPIILTGAAWPGWAAVIVALAAVVLVRAPAHRRL